MLRSIDDKIEEYNEAIVRLKRQRNHHLPVSRLPAEILTTIFLYTVLDGKTDFNFHVGWISITYVCYFWREVAINTASLWSCWGVSELNQQRIEMFLSRSRQAPLYVRMTFQSYFPHRPFVELLRKSSCQDRARELHITGPGPYLTEILDVLDRSQTSDNSLANSVSGCPMQSLFIHPTMSTIARLPKTFLSLRFPYLWRLKLVNCIFDWDSAIFDSAVLAHLTVSMRPGTNQPSMPRLLSILAKQPHLEELILMEYNVIHTGDSGVLPVHLPHLQLVELAGSASSCFTLVTRLSYPRTRIKINLTVLPEDEQDFTLHAVPFFSKHYGYDKSHCDSPPIIKHLSIMHHSWLPAQLLCTPSLNPLIPSVHEPTLCLTIKDFYTDTIVATMVAACATLPLHDVCELFCSEIVIEPEEWRLNLFDAMNNLENLKLHTRGAVGAIIALNPAPERNHPSCDSDIGYGSRMNHGYNKEEVDFPGSHNEYKSAERGNAILLPKLKTLQILGENFRYLSLANELASCLESRKHANSELNLLSLGTCKFISPDEVCLYKKHVKEVIWDGITDFIGGLHDSDCPSEESEDYGDYDGDFGHDNDGPGYE